SSDFKDCKHFSMVFSSFLTGTIMVISGFISLSSQQIDKSESSRIVEVSDKDQSRGRYRE
ncbi:MAG: hypothetical protein KAS98_16235, partial [Deltaproteobacteria bacterium]|nr:hypothetical protein [Deltaproteobacteria bacterium]